MTVPVWPEKSVPLITYAMLDLLECVCEAVAVLGSGPTCACGIIAGDRPSWDYCGECGRGLCGMAYIQPGRSFAYSTFPLEDDELSACNRPLAYELQVGVIRCIPVMDNDGEPPDMNDVTDASLGFVADQHALRTAIECCDSPYLTKLMVLGGWTPIGPTGNCVGGFWTMTLNPNPNA